MGRREREGKGVRFGEGEERRGEERRVEEKGERKEKRRKNPSCSSSKHQILNKILFPFSPTNNFDLGLEDQIPSRFSISFSLSLSFLLFFSLSLSKILSTNWS